MYDVFISYSTEDNEIVDGLSKLLRIDGRRVFRDRESIEPGELWEAELTRALSSATQIVVFWCCHASESEWVAREIDQSIAQQKRMIPVLLCDQPFPDAIAKYQWIDLRRIALHECSHHDVRVVEIKNLHPASTQTEYRSGDHVPATRRSFCVAPPSLRLIIQGLVLMLLALIQPFPNGWTGEYATVINWLTGISGAAIIFASFGSRINAQRDSLAVLNSMRPKDREAVTILYDAITTNKNR